MKLFSYEALTNNVDIAEITESTHFMGDNEYAVSEGENTTSSPYRPSVFTDNATPPTRNPNSNNTTHKYHIKPTSIDVQDQLSEQSKPVVSTKLDSKSLSNQEMTNSNDSSQNGSDLSDKSTSNSPNMTDSDTELGEWELMSVDPSLLETSEAISVMLQDEKRVTQKRKQQQKHDKAISKAEVQARYYSAKTKTPNLLNYTDLHPEIELLTTVLAANPVLISKFNDLLILLSSEELVPSAADKKLAVEQMLLRINSGLETKEIERELNDAIGFLEISKFPLHSLLQDKKAQLLDELIIHYVTQLNTSALTKQQFDFLKSLTSPYIALSNSETHASAFMPSSKASSSQKKRQGANFLKEMLSADRLKKLGLKKQFCLELVETVKLVITIETTSKEMIADLGNKTIRLSDVKTENDQNLNSKRLLEHINTHCELKDLNDTVQFSRHLPTSGTLSTKQLLNKMQLSVVEKLNDIYPKNTCDHSASDTAKNCNTQILSRKEVCQYHEAILNSDSVADVNAKIKSATVSLPCIQSLSFLAHRQCMRIIVCQSGLVDENDINQKLYNPHTSQITLAEAINAQTALSNNINELLCALHNAIRNRVARGMVIEEPLTGALVNCSKKVLQLYVQNPPLLKVEHYDKLELVEPSIQQHIQTLLPWAIESQKSFGELYEVCVHFMQESEQKSPWRTAGLKIVEKTLISKSIQNKLKLWIVNHAHYSTYRALSSGMERDQFTKFMSAAKLLEFVNEESRAHQKATATKREADSYKQPKITHFSSSASSLDTDPFQLRERDLNLINKLIYNREISVIVATYYNDVNIMNTFLTLLFMSPSDWRFIPARYRNTMRLNDEPLYIIMMRQRITSVFSLMEHIPENIKKDFYRKYPDLLNKVFIDICKTGDSETHFALLSEQFGFKLDEETRAKALKAARQKGSETAINLLQYR